MYLTDCVLSTVASPLALQHRPCVRVTGCQSKQKNSVASCSPQARSLSAAAKGLPHPPPSQTLKRAQRQALELVHTARVTLPFYRRQAAAEAPSISRKRLDTKVAIGAASGAASAHGGGSIMRSLGRDAGVMHVDAALV